VNQDYESNSFFHGKTIIQRNKSIPINYIYSDPWQFLKNNWKSHTLTFNKNACVSVMKNVLIVVLYCHDAISTGYFPDRNDRRSGADQSLRKAEFVYNVGHL
jgi:hypothetical protein